MAFWFRSSSASVTFTFKLYDVDGNVNEQDFTVEKADVWYLIWIKVDSMTGSVDWESTRCYYFDIYANGACTVYFDNYSFNDGWMFTEPSGLLNIHVADNASEEPPNEGYIFKVAYIAIQINPGVVYSNKVISICCCY